MPIVRVLICTPCGGGVVTNNYLASYKKCTDPLEIKRQFVMRDLQLLERNLMQNTLPPNMIQQARGQYQQLAAEKLYEVGLYTLAQESLLARGRNHCAQKAMVESWDKLFFIDADSQWTPEDFMKILESPYPITGGTVPLKTYPIVLNYLPFKDDQDKYCAPWNGLKTPESMWAMADEKGRYVKVPKVGTAFLCIDVKKALNKLAPHAQHYQYPNPGTGYNETHWRLFGEGPLNDDYNSEDWFFCDLARQHGFDVVIDTDVTIAHRGEHLFCAPPRPTKEQLKLNEQAQLKAQHEHYLKLKAIYEAPQG